MFPQAPVASQVCGCRPLHCLVPATQAAQLPAVQVAGHAVPESNQVPVGSQVCGCRPLHCFDHGAHTPLQIPALHR